MSFKSFFHQVWKEMTDPTFLKGAASVFNMFPALDAERRSNLDPVQETIVQQNRTGREARKVGLHNQNRRIKTQNERVKMRISGAFDNAVNQMCRPHDHGANTMYGDACDTVQDSGPDQPQPQ